MRQQFQLRALPVAIGLAGLIVAAPIQCAYARGRGGGFPHGGFSREGPAAAGSFASRSGSMAGHERGLESGARGAEANRMGQANRMEQANWMEQANRVEQAARQYHGAYPYAGAAAAWDAGAAGVAAAATGAAIGSAAAATVAAPAVAAAASAPAAYAAAQPCANAVSVPVGPLTFFRCGTAWYRQVYGPAGPTFVAVSPPGF
jgi:hypothetical protein